MEKLLESVFCILMVVEAFSLQKVVKMLEEVIVSWWEVRWIWRMRQNFLAQFVQLFKHCLYNVWLYIAVKKKGPFYWPVPATSIAVFGASHRFAEHTSQRGFRSHTSLLGFRKLQWTRQAADQQTVTMTFFFGASLTLGSSLELLLSPTTELSIAGCIKSTFRCTSQSNWEMVCRCCCLE